MFAIALLIIFAILLIQLLIQKQYNFLLALLPAWILLLAGSIFTAIPFWLYNCIWMAGPTLGSYFLGRSFKVNLSGIFLFALFVVVLAAIILSGQTNLLLLYAAFNYLIQFGILVKSIKIKYSFEQVLFGIYCVGGIGSLVTVLSLGYASVGVYLVFYYAILNLLVLFSQKIQMAREFFID